MRYLASCDFIVSSLFSLFINRGFFQWFVTAAPAYGFRNLKHQHECVEI